MIFPSVILVMLYFGLVELVFVVLEIFIKSYESRVGSSLYERKFSLCNLTTKNCDKIEKFKHLKAI